MPQGLLPLDVHRRRQLGVLTAGALSLSSFAVRAAAQSASTTGSAGTGSAQPSTAPAASVTSASGSRPGRLPERAPPAINSALSLPATRILDAGEVGAEHWRGKVLLIELWATWCPFCRKQNLLLDRFVRDHAARGLAMLGLYTDERDDDVRRYMRDAGYGFSVARYEASWWTVLGRPKGLPILWVVSRDGRLLQVESGEMFPEDINELTRWL
jgi:thiol-disulfide isomerase/thioredoxin